MKNYNLAILLALAFLLSNCITEPENEKNYNISKTEELKSDKFFQYSIWWAFVNKVFDGDLKVSELKKHGDIGLGSFDFLDGEMVMLNGTPYRIRENGEISIGEDNDEIVYADATFFDVDGSFVSSKDIVFEQFKTEITENMPNENFFYAYVVHGDFKYIKLGGVPKVEKPFEDGLDVLIPSRPVFEAENISGTLIGFYCPKFIGNINAVGFHFHFIADDLKYGGHVMEFTSKDDLTVDYDEMYEYHFQIPTNSTYKGVKLEKEFQYNK